MLMQHMLVERAHEFFIQTCLKIKLCIYIIHSYGDEPFFLPNGNSIYCALTFFFFFFKLYCSSVMLKNTGVVL